MLRLVRGWGFAIQLELQGDVDARFEPVASTFLGGFEADRDVGAALAVYSGGRKVIDVWAGHTNRRRDQLWHDDTLCCLFSATKGLTAICLLQAVADGVLELDAPVTDVWPEYGQAGKATTTLRHMLAHQAGLIGFHDPVPRELLYDWHAVTDRLAGETPWWPPGEDHGYHARTFGFLLGEVLRRATGRRVSDWLRERVAQPLQADVHIGLDTDDQLRCADMLPARIRPGDAANTPPAVQRLMARFSDTSTATGAAFQNPLMGAGYMNSPTFREAELPAMNGHGTARAVARTYASLTELLPLDVLAEAQRTQSIGDDQVLLTTSHFGLGFMLHHPETPIGLRPGTFGHAGAGGSMAFYDPDADIAYCFVMNQMEQGVITGSRSARACAESVYRCLK